MTDYSTDPDWREKVRADGFLAAVAWAAQDIMQVATLTEPQAYAWLEEHERQIQAEMIGGGWQAIVNLLREESIPTEEVDLNQEGRVCAHCGHVLFPTGEAEISECLWCGKAG